MSNGLKFPSPPRALHFPPPPLRRRNISPPPVDSAAARSVARRRAVDQPRTRLLPAPSPLAVTPRHRLAPSLPAVASRCRLAPSPETPPVLFPGPLCAPGASPRPSPHLRRHGVEPTVNMASPRRSPVCFQGMRLHRPPSFLANFFVLGSGSEVISYVYL
jgi:hypothetical protein